MSKIASPGSPRARARLAPDDATKLRAIAEMPFRGAVSAKSVDAAVKAAMARRKPEAERAVHIVLPDTGVADKAPAK